jgi:replicative DNA helicase
MSMHDERAEKHYLAACLLDPSTLEACGIPPTSMATGDHRFALGALLGVRGRGEPVDTVSLRTELQRLGWGAERALVYALGLTDHVPPSPVAVAARIRTLAEARRIAQEASEGLTHAQALDLDAARERLASASYGGTTEAEALSTRAMMEEAATAWDEVSREAEREAKGEPPRYIPLRLGRTPWSARARPTVRIGPGEMLAIGAATGTGKSSQALTEMLDLEDRGMRSGLVSVEDPAAEWGSKIIGHRGQLNTGGMWQAAGSPEDWQRATRAVMSAATSPDLIRLMHAKSGTVDEVVQCMSRLVRVHGAQVLFVDYLQAITSPASKAMTRRDATDVVIARLLTTARVLDVPLVLMSQFSRDKMNPFKEPQLGDFKESGTLENSATACLMLWILTDDNSDPRYGLVRAKIAKDKRQPRGERWCMRRGHGQVLYEVDAPTDHDTPRRRGF